MRNYWIDCLRGYAILNVVVSHAFYIEPVRGVLPHGHDYFKGDMGVHVFYFISGFLVIGILNVEMSARSYGERSTSALKFIARRIFRLQPTFLLFFVLYLLFATKTNADLDIYKLLLPISNLFAGPYITWHIKTLHLEEVFYILAVFGMLFINNNSSKVLLVALGLVVSLRTLQFLGRKFGFAFDDGVYSYLIAFDPIVIGGLCRLHFSQLYDSRLSIKIANNPLVTFVAAAAAIMLIGSLRSIKPFSYPLAPLWPTVVSLLCIPLLLSFYKSEGFPKNKYINYVGSISYSLYLLQQFAFCPYEEVYGHNYDKTSIAWVVLTVVTMTVFWSTYVERPVTRLGSKLFPSSQKRDVEPSVNVSSAEKI